MLGVRLSPERFGMQLPEILVVAQWLMDEGKIDFLDMSLWDVFKEPNDKNMRGKSLLSCFTELDRKCVRLGAAGKIRTPAEAEKALASGLDWIMLGRAAILNHDFPHQYRKNTNFSPVEIPVTRKHLVKEGLSEKFIAYISGWEGFLAK